MDRLNTELSFEQRTKVVRYFEIYNFHEENFFTFKTDFKEKTKLPKLCRVHKIPAQDFQNSA